MSPLESEHTTKSDTEIFSTLLHSAHLSLIFLIAMIYMHDYIVPQSPLNIKRPEHRIIGWLEFQMEEEVIMID